jgi:acyl-CoA hydrolase
MPDLPLVTADEAAALVRDADTLGIPLGPGQPVAFLHALGERSSFEDLVVFGALLVDLYPLFLQPGVRLRSGFFGPAERFLRDSGADVQFVPADFRRFSSIARRFAPRVVATAAAPPDESGNLSLSLHAGATVEEIMRAGHDPDRLLIVEVNPRLPRTLGLPPELPHAIPAALADVIIESDREPFVLADPEPTAIEQAIARHVATFIRDGATLQTGIGGVPSMVARLLAEGPGGDYGVHSEMFTTGLMHLHRAGKVTNLRKGIHEGYSVCTFAAGTRELYDWLDDNPDVRFVPVEHVNEPQVIAANNDMVTINGAITVDLAGQIAADTVAGRQYSGIGGHADFVAGASIGFDDRSVVCLPATATVGDQTRSRIVTHLDHGTLVTTPRYHVDVVVTEYGSAELLGKTVHERALALAEIAHPDFRDDLRESASRLGLGAAPAPT